MATTYSPNLRLSLIGTGDQQGTWGITTNTNLGTLLEEAIGGYVSVPVSNVSDTTLTVVDGASDQSRNAVINCTGSLSADANVICPAIRKTYIVKNSTNRSITFKVSGQTNGVTIPSGYTQFVYVDGTGARLVTGSIASQNSNAVSITGGDITANLTSSNVTITGGSVSGITPLPIASGGTNASNATDARTNLGLGSIATQNANNVTITGGSVTGITDLAVADGGTGVSTLTGIVKGNGTSPFSAAVAGTDYLANNQTITISGDVSGSGQTAITATLATLSPSPAGNYTNATITVNAKGLVTAASSGSGSAEFASGTRILFHQTSAPTGWTKDTSINDYALRVVSGSVSSGGTVSFSTAFSTARAVTVSVSATTATGTVGNTTLTSSQIPAHTHTVNAAVSSNTATTGAADRLTNLNLTGASQTDTGSTGGGNSHTHSFTGTSHTHTASGTTNINVQYVDVIIAQKN